jgi:hypothetical protein
MILLDHKGKVAGARQMGKHWLSAVGFGWKSSPLAFVLKRCALTVEGLA